MAGIPPISSELDRKIRQRGRDLRLRQVDRQPAVKVVNKLIKGLWKFLKDNEEQPFFRHVSTLNSGSYYELVKIHKPNEFDVMLKLQTPRIKWLPLEDHHGLFYTISLCRPTRTEIRTFLLENTLIISASKIMNEMHRLVQKFISKLEVTHGEGRWVVNKKRVNSPAVTLSFMNDAGAEVLSLDIVPALEVTQGWPTSARSGLEVDRWLGKNARQKLMAQPFYFVPKRPKLRNLSGVEQESWRISFSHIEKEMIRFHGNKKTCCEGKTKECCRKLCLRLLKCLIEELKKTYPKELKHLCSYHGKTTFFYNLSARCEDTLWTPGQLSNCFMKLLGDFEHAIQTQSLPHFFVPEYNLLSRFPKCSLLFLSNILKEQKKLELPLLHSPAPEPVLSHSTEAEKCESQPICLESATTVPGKSMGKWLEKIFIFITVVFLFIILLHTM